MRSAILRELEQKVEELSALPPSRESVPTGISQLDAILPDGGLPRGRAIEWQGPRSCGKTALLRATFASLHESGEPVAIVDTAHMLYAPDWAGLTSELPFWVVRPTERADAVWCTDLLLRSGAFGAVALDTYVSPTLALRPDSDDPSIPRNAVVRLQRLAEESGAVFVVVGTTPLAALRLRFRPARLEPVGGTLFGSNLPPLRPVWVGMDKGRTSEIPILCPFPLPRVVQPPTRDRKGPL